VALERGTWWRHVRSQVAEDCSEDPSNAGEPKDRPSAKRLSQSLLPEVPYSQRRYFVRQLCAPPLLVRRKHYGRMALRGLLRGHANTGLVHHVTTGEFRPGLVMLSQPSSNVMIGSTHVAARAAPAAATLTELSNSDAEC
jgi:hypothetical protein